MRHQRAGQKFGRNSSARTALFRSLLVSIFQHDKIITTVEKAKNIRPKAEKLITLARQDSFHNRALAFRYLQKKAVVKRLFETVAPRYRERPGGYTRIIKLGPRVGDAADMAQIELI